MSKKNVNQYVNKMVEEHALKKLAAAPKGTNVKLQDIVDHVVNTAKVRGLSKTRAYIMVGRVMTRLKRAGTVKYIGGRGWRLAAVVTPQDWSSAPKTSVEMLNEKDRKAQPVGAGVDWRAWTKELQQWLGSLLADTANLTPAQWAKVPQETRELVQAAVELEAEAAACCG